MSMFTRLHFDRRTIALEEENRNLRFELSVALARASRMEQSNILLGEELSALEVEHDRKMALAEQKIDGLLGLILSGHIRPDGSDDRQTELALRAAAPENAACAAD